MTQAVSFESVSFSYNGINVLEDITFSIDEHDFIGIIGPNGGGKTTLLKLMLGLIKPMTGKVKIYDDIPIRQRRRIGYVPQFITDDPQFPIRVKDVVAMGLLSSGKIGPWLGSDQRKRIEDAMASVKIADLVDKPFGDLSGGQRQRCIIARALVSSPDILLLDEPTASVDSWIERDLFEMLKKMSERMTIIFVTHDLGFISMYVDKVACVNRHLAIHPVSEITTDSIISEVYNKDTAMIKHRCGL